MGRFNSTFTPATQSVTMQPAAPIEQPATPVSSELSEERPAAAPQPVTASQPAAPQRTALPKASTKTTRTKHEYVAPKDAIEAKQRILDAIEKNRINLVDNDTDPITFTGATYGLKDCFRLLGGDFDKTKTLWFVPRAAWLNPATATATKSEAMLRREKEEADREAEIQAAIQQAIEADRRLRPTATPEGMITIEEAKNLVAVGITHTLHHLINLNKEQLWEIVEQVFSNRK